MHQYGYIGRKMRQPQLKEKPAIIITAFGTSSRAQMPLEIFENALVKQFPDYEVFWAYSSEIICRKLGLPGVQETLARVEAAGFRRAVVQPLHIFPGTEYQQLAETCTYFPGLRVFLSETLFHRWEFVKETLSVVEQEFLSVEEGLNLLALHGTPLAADPVNIVYLGLERLVADRYPNVLAVSLEGIPDYEAVFAGIAHRNLRASYEKVKIIPMMYLAGLHAERDLMGGRNSWCSVLEEMGFTAECSMVTCADNQYFKGLAYYPQVIAALLERLERALVLAKYY
jgi:sirohydrochlorin cobaltochelatase